MRSDDELWLVVARFLLDATKVKQKKNGTWIENRNHTTKKIHERNNTERHQNKRTTIFNECMLCLPHASLLIWLMRTAYHHLIIFHIAWKGQYEKCTAWENTRKNRKRNSNNNDSNNAEYQYKHYNITSVDADANDNKYQKLNFNLW